HKLGTIVTVPPIFPPCRILMPRSLAFIRVLTVIAVVCGASLAMADNWPQWRGQRLDGISHEKDLPITFSKTENVAWRLPLPGPGGSTPVIWEDRIFLTSVDTANGDLLLLCVGTDGK